MPMRKFKPTPTIMTSVRMSPEFHDLCYQHRIRFSEAMKVGVSVLLAEKGVQEYDNNLNFMRRIQTLTQQLEEISQKYHDLLDKQNTKV